MNMLNLINLMLSCNDAGLKSVLGIVGWVIWAVKIAVPIILIVIGMMDMAKAVTEKDENKIKDAQTKLIKKAIAAVLVFLVPTIVTLLMSVIGSDEWKGCAGCLNNPGNEECKINTSIPDGSNPSDQSAT